MNVAIGDIVRAPVESPAILVLTVLYAVIESIRIYDARLIQAKTRRFYSAVAAEAEGQFLPEWIGAVHFAGWLVFAVLLALNWKFALALFAFLFILRVVPVLERVGATIMRPWLQPQEARAVSVSDVPALGDRDHRDVPTFVTWWRSAEHQQLNLVDALEAYVAEFELYERKYADEPRTVTLGRSIITILESNKLSFEAEDALQLLQYQDGLRMRVRSYDLRVELMDDLARLQKPPGASQGST